MTIRFLQTVASGIPNVPFVAGQEIHVSDPPRFLLDLCDGVRAVIVRSDETERAVMPSIERTEPTVKTSRRKQRAVIH